MKKNAPYPASYCASLRGLPPTPGAVRRSCSPVCWTSAFALFAACALLAGRLAAQTPTIASLSANGVLTCTNLAPETTALIEWAPSLSGPWTNTWEGLQAVPADLTGAFQVPVPMFYRVRGWPDLPANLAGKWCALTNQTVGTNYEYDLQADTSVVIIGTHAQTGDQTYSCGTYTVAAPSEVVIRVTSGPLSGTVAAYTYTVGSDELLLTDAAANQLRFLRCGSELAGAPSTVELLYISQYPSSLMYDQGNLGTDSACAAAFCVRYLSVMQGRTTTPPAIWNSPDRLDISRLFLHYNSRYLDYLVHPETYPSNWYEVDFQGEPLSTLNALRRFGACPEQCSVQLELGAGETPPVPPYTYRGWPYDVGKLSTNPDALSYQFALDPRVAGGTPGTNAYANVSRWLQHRGIYLGTDTPANRQALRKRIASALSQNHPVLLGFPITEEFLSEQTAETGFVLLPPADSFPTGGLTVAIVGYGAYNPANPSQLYFKFALSWGSAWGARGFGYLPADYKVRGYPYFEKLVEVWFDPTPKANP